MNYGVGVRRVGGFKASSIPGLVRRRLPLNSLVPMVYRGGQGIPSLPIFVFVLQS